MSAAASETPATPPAGALLVAAQGMCCQGRRRGDRAIATGAGALPLDIAPDDWSELFVAVTQRLRQIAEEQTQPQPQTPSQTLVRTRMQRSWVLPAGGAVLECAQALDQLHASLLAQLAQRQTTGETLFERGGYA